MARIVSTDNFGMSGESPGRDETFVLWEMPVVDAHAIVKILNERLNDNSPTYYKVVDDDYTLLVWFP